MKSKRLLSASTARAGQQAGGHLLALAWLTLLSSCTEPTTAARESLRLDGQTMGTSWSVQVVGEAMRPTPLKGEIEQLLQRLLDIMSHYQPDSELSRFNRADDQTQWMKVSPELVQLLESANKISALSGGAFDVTSAPLVALWGFGPPGDHAPVGNAAPTAQHIQRARAAVGFRKLRLQHRPAAIATHQPPLTLDLSAIAKGYAVDQIAKYMRNRGHEHFLVEIGGEVRAHGRNAHGEKWRLAVEQPLAQSRLPLTVLHLSGSAIATSGDYRNYRALTDGRRVTHLIDPRTGQPTTHNLRSVTVLDPACARADALATALAVLGPVEGLALAQRASIPALFLVQGEDGALTQLASDSLSPFLSP